MGKLLLAFAVIILLILGGVFVFSKNVTTSSNATATIDGITYHLLITHDEKERQIGLSGRDSLPEDQGMIFQFPKEDYYGFWMKDMRFPIDIIYIDQGKIVTIYPNVPAPQSTNEIPPVLRPTQVADSVLEINAGQSAKNGFKVGDSVELKGL